MSSPYHQLPRDGISFWQPAVGGINPLEIRKLWEPAWQVTKDDTIVTAGSCFAQHIGNALQRNGFRWLDAEPAPQGLPPEVARRYGYGVFSFRTGNIYTAALLRQWVEWALEIRPASDESWFDDGRVFDPFRPAIEPGGFASAEEMLAVRHATCAAIRRAISECTIFVFTLGLTEGWRNSQSGLAYPMCPGTVAGKFDPETHEFINYRYPVVIEDLRAAMQAIRSVNPGVRFLLTVSPVPLTATASDKHVLPATTYSKSVLRAVAGDLADDSADVEYFPSYEIITAPVFRGMFYKPNAREVSVKGVDFVMSHFFGQARSSHESRLEDKQPKLPDTTQNPEEVQCEEALLGAFGAP